MAVQGQIVGGPRRPKPKPGPTRPTASIVKPKPRPGSPVVQTPFAPAIGYVGNNQDAYESFLAILESYGLTGFGEIGRIVRDAVLDGVTDSNQLELMIRDTQEWKQRFAGNEQLRAAGLPVLSVQQYLATEQSYAQIMKQAGMPTGFYDDPTDFAGFIGKSVSANELQMRVTAASDLVNRVDPAIRDQLAAAGMSQGDLTAQFLDPARAMPLLQQKYQGILIGAAARRSGLSADQAYAEKLSTLGVTEQSAIQGYGTIGEILKPLEQLGDLYGQDYGQADAEAEVFEGGSGKKRKKLASQERATFGGAAGTGSGSLGRSNTGAY